MMPLAGGAPGHPLSAAIAPAQCRWIPGAPVQLLRVRLCAGGAAADRPRAGAPHSHGGRCTSVQPRIRPVLDQVVDFRTHPPHPEIIVEGYDVFGLEMDTIHFDESDKD